MKIRLTLFFVVILGIACQVIPTPPPLKGTPASRITVQPTHTAIPSESIPTPLEQPSTITPLALVPGEMLPFPYQKNESFSQVEVSTWQPTIVPVNSQPWSVSMDEIENTEVLEGLTNRQRDFLRKNGFVVIHSDDSHFTDIRERVSTNNGQPYFLTSDAAFHALRLTLGKLLAVIEKEMLYPRMIMVLQASLDEVLSYYPLVNGTSLEADTHLAAAYLGVALKLFNSQTSLEPYLDQQVSAQVRQIMTLAGQSKDRTEPSVLFPFVKDDFGAYLPVGHYQGDPDLEAYFRGMRWLERVNFNLQLEDPNFTPSRVPLIITLALRRARIEGKLAVEEWSLIHEIMTFLVGPSLGSGPPEYSDLMDQVYGPGLTIIGLKDEKKWQTFLSLSQNLNQLKVQSSFSDTLNSFETGQGWRFMGERPRSDSILMQHLTYEHVGTQEKPRLLPSGLDITAALGSQTSINILENAKESDYENYFEQIEQLNHAIDSLSSAQWLQDAQSSWFFAVLPLLSEKNEAYPAFMRTTAWAYKDLNSVLGSWAQLRHETTIVFEEIETVADYENPASGPAPGVVEPNPPVFYRLSYLAIAIAEGLKQRLPIDDTNNENSKLGSIIREMEELGVRYQQLGDIAAKQLNGTPLDENDYLLIQTPMGRLDKNLTVAGRFERQDSGNPSIFPSVEVITSIDGTNENTLYVGTGSLDRIYVIVPIDGKLQVAQGGVFSYYEFAWSRAELITDFEWRQMLDFSPPLRPIWMENFAFADGHPVDVLAYRPGDVYIIAPMVSNLNMREEPSRNAPSVWRLQPGEYVEIKDGPVEAEGFTWWKFRLAQPDGQPIEGWAVENPEWYQRAWGQ